MLAVVRLLDGAAVGADSEASSEITTVSWKPISSSGIADDVAMVAIASCCCRMANSSGVSSGSTSEKLKTGGSSPISIIQTPCSSSSESCDNKSCSTLVVGGNSGALSFLVGSSSIWMVSVVVASAVVDTGFGTIVAVGRGDDVTLGSGAGNSVPSTS